MLALPSLSLLSLELSPFPLLEAVVDIDPGFSLELALESELSLESGLSLASEL